MRKEWGIATCLHDSWTSGIMCRKRSWPDVLKFGLLVNCSDFSFLWIYFWMVIIINSKQEVQGKTYNISACTSGLSPTPPCQNGIKRTIKTPITKEQSPPNSKWYDLCNIHGNEEKRTSIMRCWIWDHPPTHPCS